ncbi:MAG: hypothetical protein IT423_07485 [Pirellulaceae bacterium]|nr:hypothetical protein [Pirellulaceae bacterium]
MRRFQMFHSFSSASALLPLVLLSFSNHSQAQPAPANALAPSANLAGRESSQTARPIKPVQYVQPVLPGDIAELEIALGRLRLAGDRFRIIRKHDQFGDDSPVAAGATAQSNDVAAAPSRVDPSVSTADVKLRPGQRSLQVSMADGRPTLRLSYSDQQEKWTLNLDATIGAEWTREWTVADRPVKVDYKQPPHQPIAIVITGAATQPQKITGCSLWHLTEQNSLEFNTYILPALVRLNPTWDLPQALASAKRLRAQCGLNELASCQRELAQLIADLESSEHGVRSAAKQKMRDLGLASQIPLEQLRRGQLSIEQRSTIDEMLAALEPRSADTPTRLAYWLSGDPNWR